MNDKADGAPVLDQDSPGTPDGTERPAYKLDDQIGYLLRKAYQRNAVIFSEKIQDLTPTQFAVMARLIELGSVSQNRLGRTVGLDVATTKGVVDRLTARGLLQSRKDPHDKRRQLISLTPAGQSHFEGSTIQGLEVSEETLAPLSASEKRTLAKLLKKLL